MSTSKLRILVAGMMAKVPHQGGATWAVLQYLLGLRRLGHHVCFAEVLQPEDLRPAGTTLEQSDNATYFRQVVRAFDLDGGAALLLAGSDRTVGLTYAELMAAASTTDLLLNLSGTLSDPRLTQQISVRAYVDLDPAFNQIWHEVDRIDMHFADHTHFVTVGCALGSPECPVPTCGLTWITSVPPVVLERWPVGQQTSRDAFTTVANWRAYGTVSYKGVSYGQKVHALRQLITLPTLTSERFILALAIHPDEVTDLQLLRSNHWELISPESVADTPFSYRDFVSGSKAEFGLTKAGYITSQCGWFSDRSVCYLACGRPVLAQETGFSRYIPTGIGLISFSNQEEALEGVSAISRDYARHAQAARALAEAHFDSDRVLSSLLRRLGASS